MSWAWQQNNFGSSSGQLGSLAYTTKNNTSGSLLFCVIFYGSGSPSGDVTVSDATNGTWSKAYSTWYGNQYYSLWYVVNSSTSKVTVDVSYPGGGSYSNIYIEEFTGNASSSPFDSGCVSFTALGTYSGSQTLNGTAVTPAVSGELIYCFLFDGLGTSTAISNGTGFTGLLSEPGAAGDEYLVDSSTGSVTPSFNFTASTGSGGNPGGAFIIAAGFKPASGASGPNMVQQEQWWNRTAYNQ
jgi:hypothetical protein